MPYPILKHEDLRNIDPMGESLIHSDSTIKVWHPQEYAVVLGASQKVEKECDIPSLKEDSIPVYKRHGGGGAVLLSPQGFCYGIRFPRNKNWAIQDYFQQGTSVLQNVLSNHYNIESAPKGISDLAIGEKKILGCSLYMPKGCALYLASVLVNPDEEAISKYLSHPSREPDYRKGRSHLDFLTFISKHASQAIQMPTLIQQMELEANLVYQKSLNPLD